MWATGAQSAVPLVFLGDKNLPPYEYLENGSPKGANVDLMLEIGRVLGRPVSIELMDWRSAQTQLLSGRGDALTMLSRNPVRERDYAFTSETLPVRFALFVRADDTGKLSGNSLAGRRIAVPRGGIARTILLQAHPDVQPTEVESVLEGINMLVRREIDALAAQEWSAYYQLDKLGVTSIQGLPAFHTQYGNIAVRAADRATAAQLDAALAKVKANGSFERILDRWSSTRVRTVSERSISAAATSALVGVVVLGLVSGLAVQLRRRGQRLAQEVDERKAIESALRKAKEELELSDRRKDRFLATLAHELRGPMAPISNAMAILSRAGGNIERERWVLAVVGRQIDHMSRLVDDLLDISKINSGTIALRKERLVLDALLMDLVESFKPNAEQAGLQLRLDLGARDVMLDADGTRLQQVFTNLLTNAIRYTPTGGSVQVRLETIGSSAVVHVQDNGMGFGSDVVDSIFEMFYRQEQAAQKAPGGLGLGLWLCRRLVEVQGGQIEAHSKGPGQGARFTVTFPTLSHLPPPAAPLASSAPS